MNVELRNNGMKFIPIITDSEISYKICETRYNKVKES